MHGFGAGMISRQTYIFQGEYCIYIYSSKFLTLNDDIQHMHSKEIFVCMCIIMFEYPCSHSTEVVTPLEWGNNCNTRGAEEKPYISL